MKNTIKYISIMTLSLFVIIATATAAERSKIFVMAESGEVIEFLMTAEEMAVQQTERDRQAMNEVAKIAEFIEKVERIELAESGDIYEFPLSADEIAAREAEDVRQAATFNKNLKPVKAPPEVAVFEMAESGQTIEFYKARPRKVIELLQTGIAGNPDDGDASMQ